MLPWIDLLDWPLSTRRALAVEIHAGCQTIVQDSKLPSKKEAERSHGSAPFLGSPSVPSTDERSYLDQHGI